MISKHFQRLIFTFLLILLSACGSLEATPDLDTSATCGDVNIAEGKAGSASSTEAGFLSVDKAFDGNMTTRWASEATDVQWLEIDLGSSQTLCQVVLEWEAAYGAAFELQTSDDAATWTTLYTETDGEGGTQAIEVTGMGRYIRLNLKKRGTGYGYSLHEVKVFPVDGDAEAPTPTDPTPENPAPEPTPEPNPSGPSGPGVTTITGSQGNWQLTVGRRAFLRERTDLGTERRPGRRVDAGPHDDGRQYDTHLGYGRLEPRPF